MTHPGTFLYAPADRPDLVRKALRSGAEVIVADLEDGVAPDRKDLARAHLAEILDHLGPARGVGRGLVDRSDPHGPAEPSPETPPLHVRINPVTTDDGRADAALLRDHPGFAAVRLPKVSRPEDVHAATALLGPAPLHVLIESALGVENAFAIAAAPGVAAISLGEGDLSAQLGVTSEGGLDWVRSRIVVAAAAAGLPPPAMAVYGGLRDADGLRASCARGRALGMRGRNAIHPAQLAVIAAAFRPTTDEVARAERIVRAEGRVGAVGDEFVDAPVRRAARSVLTWAARYAPGLP